MEWRIKHIFNLPRERPWQKGHANFGFHGRDGVQYFLQYNEHWLGRLTPDDEFLWTAGAVDRGLSKVHIPFPIRHPHYICELPDDSLLVSSNGTNQVFRLRPDRVAAALFIDTGAVGLKDIGNCVYDGQGGLWVHEIEGCRVWQFDLSGEPVRALGDGRPGFQPDSVRFDAVRFNWIYDLRPGPDGNLYVLDSKNYAVRRIDVERGTVTTVVGTGRPGYTGDGGPALEATLGSSPAEYFDGPYSLSVDEEGHLYIGDTQNGVVRMVETATGRIRTIAGRHPAEPGVRNAPQETDPLKLNLPKICSLDYYGGCLYVPDWSDDLIVLERAG